MEWNLASSCVSVLLGDLGYCLQFVFVLNKAAETQSNSFWQGSSLSSFTSLPGDLESLLSLESFSICNSLHLRCPLRYIIFSKFQQESWIGISSHCFFHASFNSQENKNHLIATSVLLLLSSTLDYN